MPTPVRRPDRVSATVVPDHWTADLRLLLGEEFDAASVAHRVGYRQPAQFAKAFRRHRGVAPSDYRAGNGAMRTRAA